MLGTGLGGSLTASAVHGSRYWGLGCPPLPLRHIWGFLTDRKAADGASGNSYLGGQTKDLNFPAEWGLLRAGMGVQSRPAPHSDRQRLKVTAGKSHNHPQQVEPPEAATPATDACVESEPDRVYLDLTPVKSFLHSTGGAQAQASSLPPLPNPELPTEAVPEDQDPTLDEPTGPPLEPICRDTQVQFEDPEPGELPLRSATVKIQLEPQNISFPLSCPDVAAVAPAGTSPAVRDRLKVASTEIRLGKNRTEAEVKRYTEEKERLERKKEEIRAHLAQLRREKRELKESLSSCADKGVLASLEQKLREVDEECREEERRRVDLELSIVDVKDNLKKAEAGPVTLGTTVDTIHLESTSPRPKPATPCTPAPDSTPVNSATALKNRPLSVMVTGKGTVLQKAKEWEKKGAS